MACAGACVCSVIDHRWGKSVISTKKWHTSHVHYHILTSSVIYNWTDIQRNGIYLFYTMNSKVIWGKIQTCIVALDCSKIYSNLGIFEVAKNTFCLSFFFFLLVNSYYLIFIEALTCLIWKTLTNIFKTVHRVGQKQSKQFFYDASRASLLR